MGAASHIRITSINNMNQEEYTVTERLDVLFRKCFHYMGRGRHHRGEGRVGHGQGRLMGMIARQGEINQKDLLDLLDIRPSSLSEMLGKLEAEGYILRQKDEADKRSVIISITESGRHIVSQTMQARREYVDHLFAPLSVEEQEHMIALLEKLAETWDEQDDGDCDERPRHPHCHHGRGHRDMGHRGHGRCGMNER